MPEAAGLAVLPSNFWVREATRAASKQAASMMSCLRQNNERDHNVPWLGSNGKTSLAMELITPPKAENIFPSRLLGGAVWAAEFAVLRRVSVQESELTLGALLADAEPSTSVTEAASAELTLLVTPAVLNVVPCASVAAVGFA